MFLSGKSYPLLKNSDNLPEFFFILISSESRNAVLGRKLYLSTVKNPNLCL